MLSDDGREITLYRLTDGDACVLAAACVIRQITFEVQLVADAPTELLILGAHVFQQLTAENFDTLNDMVQQCLTDPKYAQGRDTARAQTWVCPGEGAVRAADYLEQKMKELAATHEEKEP